MPLESCEGGHTYEGIPKYQTWWLESWNKGDDRIIIKTKRVNCDMSCEPSNREKSLSQSSCSLTSGNTNHVEAYKVI